MNNINNKEEENFLIVLKRLFVDQLAKKGFY
jgi:hypothetical protein